VAAAANAQDRLENACARPRLASPRPASPRLASPRLASPREKCIRTRNRGRLFEVSCARRSKGLSDQQPERRATRRTFQGERDSSSKKNMDEWTGGGLSLSLSLSPRLSVWLSSSSSNVDAHGGSYPRETRDPAGKIRERRLAGEVRASRERKGRKSITRARARAREFGLRSRFATPRFIIPGASPDLIPSGAQMRSSVPIALLMRRLLSARPASGRAGGGRAGGEKNFSGEAAASLSFTVRGSRIAIRRNDTSTGRRGDTCRLPVSLLYT